MAIEYESRSQACQSVPGAEGTMGCIAWDSRLLPDGSIVDVLCPEEQWPIALTHG